MTPTALTPTALTPTSLTPTVRTVTGWLEDAFPPALAEAWDRVGLAVGDPDARVHRILFAVDVTDAVIDEARAWGAQLLVTHHPLLLRGVHAVRRDEPKGRLVTALIESGIALFTAHTNADAASPGVSDALASVLGLTGTRPLQEAPGDPLDKVVTFVPPDHLESVIGALTAAGAGAIGDYDGCAFTSEGTGRFRPLDGADPFIGTRGQLTLTPEVRVEMVSPRGSRRRVVAALLAAHPYETPAFDVTELAQIPSTRGLGRVGDLPEPLTAGEVAARLAQALPRVAGGVRLGGDPDRAVRTVAVMGGSGDSFLDAARAAHVDLYVTSDLRHHPAGEFLLWKDAPALVDISHWAAEWTWLPEAESIVIARASRAGLRLDTRVSRINTDPWTTRYE